MRPDAEICRDAKRRPEPESELRHSENIPLPERTALPLPMQFGLEKPNDRLGGTIDDYMVRQVLPHVPDAWVDFDKTTVGYEIPISHHFYVYKPPRSLDEIEVDINALEGEIAVVLEGLVGCSPVQEPFVTSDASRTAPAGQWRNRILG